MMKRIFRQISVALILIAFVSTFVPAQTIEVNAGVFQKNSKRFVGNLTAADFELTENNSPRKILSVAAESRPLSIVVIPTLGAGKTCGKAFFIYPNIWALQTDMSVFSRAVERNIKLPDELAIITTDAEQTQLRRFDSVESIAEGFKQATVLSERLQETITTTETNYNSKDVAETVEKSYTGVKVNALKETLFKAFDYLKANKKAGNRSVVMLARTVYNTTNLTDADELEIKRRLLDEEITLHWIGDNTETVFMRLFPEKDFYRELPAFTGGIKEPCNILKEKKASVLDQRMANIFAQTRQSYRIIYQSEQAVDDQMRLLNVQLSVAGRRKTKSAVVVSAPQFVRAGR